jgi:hypothetical protein
VVLAARRLGDARRRPLTFALAGCVAVQLGMAGWVAVRADPSVQIKRHEVTYDRRPVSFELGQQQQFRIAGEGRPPQPALAVQTSRAQAEEERIRLTSAPAAPGTLFRLDAIASPLVTVRGDARQVALTPDGFIVAQVLPPPPGRPWQATVEPSWPWPATVGAGLSVLSLLVALAWLMLPPGRRRRLRSGLRWPSPSA